MSQKDNSYHAVVHIMKAAVFAHAGMHKDAHAYAHKAYGFAQAHREHLEGKEDHKGLASFNHKISPMFTHLETVLSKVPSATASKPGIIARAKNFVTGKLTKSTVYPNVTTAQNVRAKQKVNRSPGKDARYDYKSFNDMAPEDKSKARMAFRHSSDSLENYHYAHDKSTGDMVHGQRWLQPKGAPEAKMGTPGKATGTNPPEASAKILPHHMPGAAVRIQAMGHDFHGSLGEVQAPNPAMPGQIKVRVANKQTKRFEDTYVQPHQVQLSKPLNKSEPDNVILMDKTRAALKRIKSPKES